MRRITVDEVRAACEATGYRLVVSKTLDTDQQCGCPVGILALSEAGTGCRYFGAAAGEIGLDRRYADGFADSFDGWVSEDSDGVDRLNEYYRLGIADGSAIRLALLPDAPAPPTINLPI